jgi:hypothetical protein
MGFMVQGLRFSPVYDGEAFWFKALVYTSTVAGPAVGLFVGMAWPIQGEPRRPPWLWEVLFGRLSSSDSGSSSLSAKNATVGSGAAFFDELEVGTCLEDLTIGESEVDCKARHDVEVYEAPSVRSTSWVKGEASFGPGAGHHWENVIPWSVSSGCTRCI